MKTLCKIILFLLIAIPVLFFTAQAQASYEDICIRSIGAPGTGPPVIDGIVKDEAAWNNATRVNLGEYAHTGLPTGLPRTAVFQMGIRDQSIFLAIEVDSPEATAGSHDTTVVLAFDTDGDPNNDWLIHITPFDAMDLPLGYSEFDNKPAATIKYWRTGTDLSSMLVATVNNPDPNSMVFWMSQDTRIAKKGSTWSIEMKIPCRTDIANASADTGIYFPASGTFSFYLDVISTQSLYPTSVYTQTPWPDDAKITPGTYSFLHYNTPDLADWGTVSVYDRPECKGVSLASNAIGTYHPDGPSWISLNNTNTFFARPQNSMDYSANGVYVTFKIANWGITTLWQPIDNYMNPGSYNPTDPNDIPAGGSHEYNLEWTLDATQSSAYAGNTHQCILVEMDTNNTSVIFRNKSIARNMDFKNGSLSYERAAISAAGYEAPPLGREQHEFLIDIDTKVQEYKQVGDYYMPKSYNVPLHLKAAEPQLLAADLDQGWLNIPIPIAQSGTGVNEAMTWTARAYKRTGDFLTINGNEYESAEQAGGFGYVVFHKWSMVQNWVDFIVGADLEDTGIKGLYSLQIPPGGLSVVETVIKSLLPEFRITLPTVYYPFVGYPYSENYFSNYYYNYLDRPFLFAGNYPFLSYYSNLYAPIMSYVMPNYIVPTPGFTFRIPYTGYNVTPSLSPYSQYFGYKYSWVGLF